VEQIEPGDADDPGVSEVAEVAEVQSDPASRPTTTSPRFGPVLDELQAGYGRLARQAEQLRRVQAPRPGETVVHQLVSAPPSGPRCRSEKTSVPGPSAQVRAAAI
jgi:hypothetical protein